MTAREIVMSVRVFHKTYGIGLSLISCLLIGMHTIIAHCETKEFTLTTGRLFIPNTGTIRPQAPDLILHLHGAPGTVEKNIRQPHPDAIHVNITLPGLSSVYKKHFQDPSVFPSLLQETKVILSKEGYGTTPTFRRIILMSFSAGFGGVRELLKQAENVEQIDAIIMADSIYAGFVGETEDRKVNPSHMEPFLSFAKQAVTGKKQMIISHTQLFTPEYASTKETAAWLIDGLSGKRIQERKEHPGGMVEWSHFQKGRFHVLEFEGETGEDHMKHLRHIDLFLQMVHTE